MAPLSLAGLQPRAPGPCKDDALNPHGTGVPVSAMQETRRGDTGIDPQCEFGQPWPWDSHPVHGPRLPGPRHEGAAAWLAVLVLCHVPRWLGWGDLCPWCCPRAMERHQAQTCTVIKAHIPATAAAMQLQHPPARASGRTAVPASQQSHSGVTSTGWETQWQLEEEAGGSGKAGSGTGCLCLSMCMGDRKRLRGQGSQVFPSWLSIWDGQNMSKGLGRSSPVYNLGRLCAGCG